MKSKQVDVELTLDVDVWQTLDFISEHSKVSRDDVISVILVTKMLSMGVYDDE